MIRATAAAECRGDVEEAYRLHSSLKDFDGSTHGMRLRLMAGLGDLAPEWLVGRWLTVVAHRSIGIQDGPHPAMERLCQTLLSESGDLILPTGLTPELLVARLHQDDWVLRQLMVYDYGGLRKVLAQAGPLVGRAGPLADWPDAALSGWRLEAADGEHLTVTDLSSGDQREVLDLGLAFELEIGECVLGRVVPTDTPPGHLFEWRPLPVDAKTAEAVATRPRGVSWLDALEAQRRQGALPAMFHLSHPMSLTTDLEVNSWMGVLLESQVDLLRQCPDTECLDDGLIALMVVENILRVAATSSRAARDLVAPMTLVLAETTERVAAALPLLAIPEFHAGWQALAEVIPDYLRPRVDALVAASAPRRTRCPTAS